MRRQCFWMVALTTLSMATCVDVSRAEEGWRATVDHLLLAPKLSSTGVGNIFYFDPLPSSSYQEGQVAAEVEYAQRLTLGYEGDRGGGAQVRWFTFDHSLPYTGNVQEAPPVFLLGSLNIDVDAIDAEFTQRGRFGIWDLQATAGARYARASIREEAINFEDLSDTIWFGPTGTKFEGAGPTLSVAGLRSVFVDGLQVFARGRTALLFGDTDLFSAFRSGGSYTVPDDFVQVWEIQMGTQLQRRFSRFDLNSGIFWEAQRWDSDSNLLGDLAFHGFGVQTGIGY